jgi:predicted metal-dependent hydrolase
MDFNRYFRGVALFNRGAFFESHEVFEDAWRDAPEPERKFLQGLIQAAVAFHHHGRGNPKGARSLLGRALENLAPFPGEFGGLELGPLRQSIADWQQALDKQIEVPALPTLRLSVAAKDPRA